MFWGKRYDAFISYSHKDAEVVKPLVELLSLNDRRVFWDRELAPGDQWNHVIQSSVRRSSIFVLFWCCDTGQSDYAAEEIAVALRLKKKIVPVKLCPAAMPQPLAQWQWIDLQKRVEHRCADLDHQVARVGRAEAVVTSRRFPSIKLAFTSLACLVFTLAAMLYFDLHYRSKGFPTNSTPPAFGPLASPRIPVPGGFAVVHPPDDSAGSIIVYNTDGEIIQSYQIPFGPPEPPLNMAEQPISWWYANRAILLGAVAFTLAAAFFTWIIRTNRARTAHTLSITKDYLERLA